METRIRKEWFRTGRSYKVVMKIYQAIDKFNALAAREFATAVNATRLELATNFLNSAGKGHMAHNLFTELRQAQQDADAGIHVPRKRKRSKASDETPPATVEVKSRSRSKAKA